MPWSAKQNKLFRAIANGWTPPKGSGISISQSDAERMAAEGIKEHPAAKAHKYLRRKR